MSLCALVTGGVSGIGAACVKRLRTDGIKVITLDVDAAADYTADVRDHGAVKSLVNEIGQIDILVNSAGIVGPNMMLWDVDPKDWANTMDINVTGVFNTCHAVVPGMRARGWGRIVNIASVAGKEGNPLMSAYSASKAAVIGLTKSLGKELALDGVLVNAVAPALVDSPMNDDESEEALAYMRSLIPMRRTGSVDEIAELVAWLCSDKVSFSTGAVYDISGGRATY